jgi:Pyruvate/2-oxoacid:ferredoxin oxidoreductase delta subunit
MKPMIDIRRCPAQEAICLAIQVCEPGAIHFVEDEHEPLGGRITIDYDLCDECGRCAEECCGRAIEMQSGAPSFVEPS